MSELKPEQTQAEQDSVGTGATVSPPTQVEASRDPDMVSFSPSEPGPVDAPTIAPDHETLPKEEAPKIEMPKLEASRSVTTSKGEGPRLDAVNAAAANADRLKAESFKADASGMIGRLLIMSPGDRARRGTGSASQTSSEHGSDAPGRRRFAGMAAVVALATLAGAFGGALATTALGHFVAGGDAAGQTARETLETTVARIDADVVALKAGLEHTAKVGTSQFNKTNDRLDKIEKAQAEPTAKLAKLSEALDKFRAAPAAAAATATPAAAREVTGSVTPPAGETAKPTAGPASAVASAAAPPAAAAPPKTEIARLPTVDSWNLREVAHGGALIEGRQGLYEVYAGDPVPGLGKVDAIRKQDGRWVVVTSRGLIVAR